MNNREKILQFLSNNTNGACDDCISTKAEVIPRQTVNLTCNPLQQEGIIERARKNCPLCMRNKIVNCMRGSIIPTRIPLTHQTDPIPEPQSKAWNWEGNVQSAIVQYLCAKGYKIIRVANTETREQGKDIEANTPAGETLWISVKGFPEKSQNTQARHWFSQALFDIILYREENTNVQLGIGLPDEVRTYLNLAARINWFKGASRLKFFWVSKNGSVREE